MSLNHTLQLWDVTGKLKAGWLLLQNIQEAMHVWKKEKEYLCSVKEEHVEAKCKQQ